MTSGPTLMVAPSRPAASPTEGPVCRACAGRDGEHKLGCLVQQLQARFRVTGLGDVEDPDTGATGFVSAFG